MRWINAALVVYLVACGSSQDDGPSDGTEDGQVGAAGSSVANDNTAAGGGSMASGGNATVSGGSSGATGKGGGVGAGGAASAGGAGVAGQGGRPQDAAVSDDASADVAHPPVAPCPGAPAAVGVWQNVEPPAFHAPTNMQAIIVVVNPLDASVLAAASNKTNGGNGSTGIYKSSDCGASWKMWGTGTHASDLATGQLWAMLVDPASPESVYVANGYGSDPTVFKSVNGGVDWQPLAVDAPKTPRFVQAIAMDPHDSRHLAVTYHADCGAPFTRLCLGQSRDGGATWTELDGPPSVPGWQEGASLSILATDSYLYAASPGGFFTGDGGHTWTKVIQQGVFGRYAGSTDLAPDGTLYLGVPSVGIFSSRANPTAMPPALLGGSFTLILNSPGSTNIIDDGVTLVAAQIDGPPFWSASLSAPSKWTHMSSPNITSGSNQMAYDAAHHIIYSANFQSGLLRLVTR